MKDRFLQWLDRLNPREMILSVIIMLMVVTFVLGRSWILPAYDAWKVAKTTAQARRLEYAKLSRFLEVREDVMVQYETLPPEVFQKESDQITLSHFLRKVEELARHPSMTIVSAKPQTIESKGKFRQFPIRLSVSGVLPEVTQFIVELLNGPDVVGLESFSLRGVQGGREVECTLSIWMVRLAPLKSDQKPSKDALTLNGNDGVRSRG